MNTTHRFLASKVTVTRILAEDCSTGIYSWSLNDGLVNGLLDPKDFSGCITDGGHTPTQDLANLLYDYGRNIFLGLGHERRKRQWQHDVPMNVDKAWRQKSTLPIDDGVVAGFIASFGWNDGKNLVPLQDNIVARNELIACAVKDGYILDEFLVLVTGTIRDEAQLAVTQGLSWDVGFNRHAKCGVGTI